MFHVFTAFAAYILSYHNRLLNNQLLSVLKFLLSFLNRSAAEAFPPGDGFPANSLTFFFLRSIIQS